MSTAALALEGLGRNYGRVAAVEGLTLGVEAGQIFGFLGPNGAGKTTTLRMLVGLVRPTRGEAWILGRSCRSPQARARGRVGALVEEPAFYGYLSGRRNLELLARLSGGAARAEVDQALMMVGLKEVGRRRVSAYSHGMRQRLGLAQALLPRPQVLLLDEPSMGLDPRGRVEFRELLRALNHQWGMTIFLSSHLLEEVEQLCTHVGLLLRGKLLACGPTGELLRRGRLRVEVRAEPAAEAERVLAAQGAVEDLRSEGERLVFTARPEELAGLNAALVRAGVAVSALVPQGESLEDFYLRLTDEGDHVGSA